MSGGSMNYFYSHLEEYENRLGDHEMNDLVHDLVKVFHDKEWADDGDISDGGYNQTLQEFKAKWFTKEGSVKRRTKYIDDMAESLKRSFGYGAFCKDCVHWTKDRLEDYGQCKDNAWLTHGYENPCDEFNLRKGELK